jgi:hypothetical protein
MEGDTMFDSNQNIIPVVLFPVVLFLSGCSQKGKLPGLLFDSLRTGDLSGLEALLPSRNHYKPGVDSSDPRSPPAEQPAASAKPTSAALVFERLAACRLSDNVQSVRAYGTRLGINWQRAVLDKVLLRGQGGSEIQYEEGVAGAWLVLVIRSGDKRMSVLASLRQTGDGVKLLGALAASALGSVEREAVYRWQPGFDKELDLRMARSIIDGRATQQWLDACCLHGTNRLFLPGYSLQLPPFFSEDVQDEMYLEKEGAVLQETSPTSLEFSGEVPIALPLVPGEQQVVASEPVTVALKENVAVRTQNVLWARINGKDRALLNVPGRTYTVEALPVRTVVFGDTGVHHHTVELTFTGGVVSRVVVGSQSVE